MKKTGIIKVISNKDGGKHAFTLEDAPEVWYNGFGLLAKKGDEIEFEFDEKSTPFNNYSKVVVLRLAEELIGTESSHTEERPWRVDGEAMKCVRIAAMMISEGKATNLQETTKEVCEAFLEAKKTLCIVTTDQ